MHCFGHIHEGWGAERIVWKEVEGEEWGGESVWVEVDAEEMDRERAVYVDGSAEGRQVVFGRETLMVNASIMSVAYKPWQGPWVVDLDLERG
jgi:hypothetical protein